MSSFVTPRRIISINHKKESKKYPLFLFYNLIVKPLIKPVKGGIDTMDTPKVKLSEAEKMFKVQIERESYVRSLIDDFSVVDRVIATYNGGTNNGRD